MWQWRKIHRGGVTEVKHCSGFVLHLSHSKSGSRMSESNSTMTLLSSFPRRGRRSASASNTTVQCSPTFSLVLQLEMLLHISISCTPEFHVEASELPSSSWIMRENEQRRSFYIHGTTTIIKEVLGKTMGYIHFLTNNMEMARGWVHLGADVKDYLGPVS